MNISALRTSVCAFIIAASPAYAQMDQPGSSDQGRTQLEYPVPADRALERALRDDERGASPSRANSAQSGGGVEIHTREDSPMPFPPPDVSDSDLETWAERARAARDAERREARPDGGRTTSANDRDEVEGAVIPEDFLGSVEQYDRNADSGSDRAESAEMPREYRARSAERGPAGAWDGPYEGDLSGSFHAGDLRPDPEQATEQAKRAREGSSGGAERSRSDMTASTGRPGGESGRDNAAVGGQQDEISREDRRQFHRRAGQMALANARRVLPSVNFETYSYGVDGSRLFEFAGTDRETGRRVEVDVLANGRIEEIEEQIPLGAVPDGVRSAVRGVLGLFWVARVERSLRADDTVFYEFEGRTASGLPLSVEIRQDGRFIRIEEAGRG